MLVGEGTIYGLRNEFSKLDRCCNDDECMLVTFSLHGHNVTIKSLSDKFLGAVGI